MNHVKYRLWDKRTNQMFPVASINFGDDGSARTIMVESAPKGKYYNAIVHGENGVLLQLTGITDKNDTPIYEGDILGLDDPTDHSRALIVFRNAAFHAELVGAPYIDDPHWTTIDSNWIVIGNRFDNPELLKRAGAA